MDDDLLCKPSNLLRLPKASLEVAKEHTLVLQQKPSFRLSKIFHLCVLVQLLFTSLFLMGAILEYIINGFIKTP